MALTPAKIAEIEEESTAALREVFGSLDAIKLPVDITKLIQENGLTLQKVHFQDPAVAGTFDRTNLRIRVNDEDPSWRQAFTAAHELGHFKLHQAAEEETFYRLDIPKASDGTSQLDANEQQANWFAASVLMPAEVVRRLWKLSNDPDRLADVFGVSSSAMRYRLINLGLLNK